MSFISFPNDPNIMNAEQLDQLKTNYAELIVEGMDMDILITFAIESIEQNIKHCLLYTSDAADEV